MKFTQGMSHGKRIVFWAAIVNFVVFVAIACGGKPEACAECGLGTGRVEMQWSLQDTLQTAQL